MSARSACLLLGAAMLGCVTDHAIGVELRPPRSPDGGPAVPAEVVAYELRLYRTDEGCPSAPQAASAHPFARLGHVQSFDAVEGIGDAIGELPPGRWALAALARDAECGVRLYGCAELDVGVTAPSTLVVSLAEIALEPTCGSCRACAEGTCAPLDAECP